MARTTEHHKAARDILKLSPMERTADTETTPYTLPSKGRFGAAPCFAEVVKGEWCLLCAYIVASPGIQINF